MDFHSLTRKELQTLCKKNKIPANITNVAMADALKALQFVEGIDEFLNPSESVTAQSSIESPEKTEVTSPCVPRTGGRTSRRKTVKDEVENSQTLTRTRRSTRKLVETPVASNNRKAPVSSVCRKMDAQLKDVSETPSVLPSSRRRGRKLMGENTVIRTYSTRRSARLSEKNVNKKIEIVKSELFSEESGENEEIPGRDVEESSNDLGEIIETTEMDLKEESEGELERNNVKEFSSDLKSDGSNEDQIQFDSSKLVRESSDSFVVVSPEMKIEDTGVEYRAVDYLKTEVHSEILEEKDPSADTFDEPLEMHDEVQEKRCGDLYLNEAEDALENGDNLDANQEIAYENLAAETVDCILKIALKGFHDFADDAFTTEDKALEVNEEIIDLTEGGNSGSPDDLSVIEEVHENSKMENDLGFPAMSEDNNVEVDKCSKDLAALDINDGALTEDEITVAEESVVIISKSDEQGIDLTSAQELLVNSPSEEECVDNNMIKDTTPQELNASADLLPELTASDDERAKRCDVVGSLEEEYHVDNNMMKDTTAQELNASDDLLPELTASDDKRADGPDVGSLEEDYVDNNMIEETSAMELNASADSEKSPIKQLGIQEASVDDGPLFSNALTVTTANDLLPELTASDDKRADGPDVGSVEEDYVDNNMREETSAMELNASADSDSVDDGPLFSNALTVPTANDNINTREIHVFNVTAEPSKILSNLPEAELSHNVLPTCLTPSKKSANKTTTPMKKSASRKTPKKLNHLFDDKENIDNSGSKLILLTKEKKKNKDFGLSTQYIDVSLRKLKKELKEKLETGKNQKKDEEQVVMMSPRPALQAVSENIVEKNNPQDI